MTAHDLGHDKTSGLPTRHILSRHAALWVVIPVLTILLAACQSTSTSAQMTLPNPAISPGSVLVEARLIACSERPKWTDCELEVVLVREYGAATPNLPAGTKISASILSSFLATLNDAITELVTPGKVALYELATVRHLSPDTELPEWKVVQIKSPGR